MLPALGPNVFLTKSAKIVSLVYLTVQFLVSSIAIIHKFLQFCFPNIAISARYFIKALALHHLKSGHI